MAAYSIHIRYTFFPLERSTSKSHPCVYGGKASAICNFAMAVGSPPRMRGKESALHHPPSQRRITPAHAGKRNERTRKCPRRWDHPRACGAKQSQVRVMGPPSGSPPRKRGQAPRRGHWPHRPWDHPRACGEKRWSGGSYNRLKGSPPRMRGEGPRPGQGRAH